MPAITLVLAFLVPLAVIRAPGLELTCLAFLLLHSWTPHKEMRFLLPLLPVMFALAGIGASVFWERLASGGAVLITCAVAAPPGLSPWRFHRLTFLQLGQYQQTQPDATP